MFMKLPEGLLPVRVHTKGKFMAVDNELVQSYSLLACNGKTLAGNLPYDWVEYLEKIINMKELEYDIVRKAMQKELDQSTVVFKFRFAGTPMEHKDTRIIKQHANNQFSLEPSIEYKKRRKALIREFASQAERHKNILPFKYPIAVQGIFRFKKSDTRKYQLTELIRTVLMHLEDLRIIHSVDVGTVKSVDGSRIEYTDSEPYTEVIIKRFPAG